ncbi:MAG: DivIVA domain-containing protein [Oscillospiraceae bacterium]|nr:DivIVA domain-containing protein [Oscillospiraceae bacterium]
MFTAEEIRQITFEKVMRGYRPEDVESFMENIADEFEALEKEKRDLEEKLYLLAEKVEQYKAEEESIKTTLINAQRLGESIVSDARVKADNVIREATIKKNDIISSAYNEIEGTEDVLNRLKKEVSDFKRNILSLYKSHIESLSTLPEEKAEEPVEQQPEEAVVEEVVVEAVIEEPVQDTVVIGESVVPEDKFKSVSSLFNEE